MRRAGELQVTVKCPAVLSLDTADYVVTLPEGSLTVRDLKEALAKAHPCQPQVSDQRLIHRGRLMEDTQTLQQVWGARALGEEPLVVHMVLRSGHYAPSPSRPPSPVSVPQEPETATSPTPAPASPPPTHTRSEVEPAPTPGPATVCAVVNNQGQSIPTDLSQALFFDGRRFYTLRGATLPFMRVRHAADGDGPLAAPHRGREEPAAPGRRVLRIRLNLMDLFAFLVRLWVILLLFSKNSSGFKLGVIGLVFAGAYLVQLDVLPTPLSLRQLRGALGRVVERIQRRRDAQQQQQVAEDGAQEGPLAGPEAAPPHPVTHLFEVFLTFVASLFPPSAHPPPPPNNNNDGPAAAVVA